MRLTHSNEIRGGAINFYGCDNDDCACAYKELPFSCVCYLCAQSVEKGVPVISFKDDHGQWHSNHHDFESCMFQDEEGVYPRVTEYKPRGTRTCSLEGSQWECTKSGKICKDEQICQAGPLGPVHVKCYRYVFDTEVKKFESWRLGFHGHKKRTKRQPNSRANEGFEED